MPARNLVVSFVVSLLCLELATAGAPTSFGGATKTKSLITLTTAANAGDLVFWFTPATEVPAGGTITLTAGAAAAAAIANTVCTVTANDGATSIPTSDTAAEIKWTSTTVLLVTTKTTAIVAAKIVKVQCAAAQLAANAAAGAIAFQVETSADTTKTGSATGYNTVAAGPSVTWGTVVPGTLGVGLDPVSLVLTFTPNTEIATTGTVKLTADKAIFAADAAATCTATTTKPATGASAAVEVDTAVVTGTKKILTVTMKGTQQFTLGYSAVITCTSNLAVNPAAGAVVFGIETSGDTLALATSQTGYTTAPAVAWGGAIRTLSNLKDATNTVAGELVFWFTPSLEIAAGGTITLESDTELATAIANTVCTVKGNDGATTIPTSDTAAQIGWTSKKILLVTTKTTAIVANKVASISCANAQLDANGAAAADVKFKVKTSADTADTALTTGYSVVAAASVTWGSATVDVLNATSTANKLTVNLTPNKNIAAAGTIKLTASHAIWNTTTTCTITTTSTLTGASAAVTVTSAAITGTQKILTVTIEGTQLPTVGKQLTMECNNLVSNPTAGTAVTFSVETSGDTTAITGQTGYTTIAAPPAPPTPPTPAASASGGNGTGTTPTGTFSTVASTITFSGYTYAVSAATTNFGNLVSCAFARCISDSASTMTSHMCTASAGPTFTYASGASSTNTVAAVARRAGSTVATSLKIYETTLSKSLAESAGATAFSTMATLNTQIGLMNTLASTGFSAADMTAASMTPPAWTTSSAAVVLPSMMAMFSAVLLVLMQ